MDSKTSKLRAAFERLKRNNPTPTASSDFDIMHSNLKAELAASRQVQSTYDKLKQSQHQQLNEILSPKPQVAKSVSEAAAQLKAKATEADFLNGFDASVRRPTDANANDSANTSPVIRDTLLNQWVETLPETRQGGFYITNPNVLESYYLLFTDNKTYILPAALGIATSMKVLWRVGAGIVNEQGMKAIIDAKPSITQLKLYHQFVQPTSHQGNQPAGQVWTMIGTPFLAQTWITAPVFRLDTNSSTIVW